MGTEMSDKERLLSLQERIDTLVEPGKHSAVVDWVHRFAEERCGRSPVMSDSPATYIDKYVDDLQEKVARLGTRLQDEMEFNLAVESDVHNLKKHTRYLLSLCSGWKKRPPKGLSPLMYITSSYEGDMKVWKEVEKIRKKVEKSPA